MSTMWHISCLASAFLLLLMSDRLGAWLLNLLPLRVRSHAILAYAPAAGLSVLVTTSAAIGWLVPYKTWYCLPLGLLGVMACFVPPPSFTPFVRRLITLATVTALCGLPWIYTLARYEAFNPYNDAFIYLCQAQWLQVHPFRTPAVTSGYYPWTTQTRVAQANNWPMGASFLLAFLQAAVGADWSFLVFPVLMMTAAAVCAIAAAGTIRIAATKHWPDALACGTVIATGLGGVPFGAAHGFYPQTLALAIASGSVGLWGLSLAWLKPASLNQWRTLLALCCPTAALVLTYHALTPFVLASFFISSTLYLIKHRSHVTVLLTVFGKASLLTALLTNYELLRFGRSLPLWATVVVGAPVDWHVARYLAHAAGLVAGAWDAPVALLRSNATTYAALGALLLIGGVFGMRLRLRRRVVLVPHTVLLGILVLGFCYYRYCVVSPWPEGLGQSWSQFKIANWSSPFLMTLLLTGLMRLAVEGRLWRAAAGVALLGWLGLGLLWNCKLWDTRTMPIREQTGSDRPFRYYASLREVLRVVPPDEVIYLAESGGLRHKHRQMVVYFLHDRPLAADWSDDGYLVGQLPAHERSLRPEDAQWVLALGGRSVRCLPTCLGSGATLRPRGVRVILSEVHSRYPGESDGSGRWWWTDREMVLQFQVSGRLPAKVRLHFAYLPANRERTVQMKITGAASPVSAVLVMPPGWGAYASEPFTVTSESFYVHLICAEPPERISKGDPRLLSFLIKNPRVEVLYDKEQGGKH